MIKSVSQVNTAAGVGIDDPEAARKFAWNQAWDGNRDQWGRPRVMLPDGSREVGYRRASSYGAPLEDQTAINNWKMRQVARGVARSSALQLAVTRVEVGLDSEDKEIRKKSKKDLDGLCEDAMEAVGSGDAASIGTSLHDILELIDLGKDPGHIPDAFRADVAAYRRLTESFVTVSSERIVVQDDHRVGGSLDRALQVVRTIPVDHPQAEPGTVIEQGSVLLGDVKTAQSMDFAGCKFGIQCWCYATSVPYNPIDKVRLEWGHEVPRTDWAVILHVPSGKGIAALYWVNLRLYAEAAADVREIYAWRNKHGKSGISLARQAEDFTTACENANSVDELMSAYHRAVAAGEWNDLLKQRFGRRRVELEERAS